MNRNSVFQKDYVCRGCSSRDVTSLLTLSGFPKAAQFFLKGLEQTAEDQPITLLIHQCEDCGLVQLMNEPVSYYKDVITAAALSDKSKEILTKEWDPIVKNYMLDGKKAMEIGACRGDFLPILNQLGMYAVGLENSNENILISESIGVNVQQGYLLDAICEDKFDLVVCNNYLEHQPNIKEFLKKTRELLVPDGLVYFSVPNFDYLLGRSCLYEFVSDHLVYFNQKTLRVTFESNGFDVQIQYEKNNGNDLVILAKKSARVDLKSHCKTMDRVVASLRTLLSDAAAAGRTVVSWGAGHRALALLALADARSIEYVVDSAPFKQNMITPQTHLHIRSPEYLMKHGCDILILMLPGSLALQVQDQLKRINLNCHFVLFDDSEIDTNAVNGFNYE